MQNNSTLTVLIFTRDINYNPEKLTIYARITVDGRGAEISLKRYVEVNVWDVFKGRVIGTTQSQDTQQLSGRGLCAANGCAQAITYKYC